MLALLTFNATFVMANCTNIHGRGAAIISGGLATVRVEGEEEVP